MFFFPGLFHAITREERASKIGYISHVKKFLHKYAGEIQVRTAQVMIAATRSAFKLVVLMMKS